MDFEPREFRDVIEQAATEGWTRLAATLDKDRARWLVEELGWPVEQVVRLEAIPNPEDWPTLHKLAGLTELRLEALSIGDDEVRAIADHLHELINLDLSKNLIGDDGARAIAGNLHELVDLDLCDNAISDDGAIAMAEQLNGLTDLDLSQNSISDDGACAIAAHLIGLDALALGYNEIGVSGARAIAKNLGNLTYLNLSSSSVGDAGAHAIAQHLTNLTYLVLPSCSISDAGARAIAEHLCNLTTLYLWKNSIQADGAAAIAEHLSGLITLNLWSNSIGDTGAHVIAEHLHELVDLDLGDNSIGVGGAIAIAENLTKLVELNLSDNLICDHGSHPVLNKLKELRELHLVNCGLTSLPDSFAGSPELHRISLASNSIEGLPEEMMLKRWEEREEFPTAKQIFKYYARVREQERQGEVRPLNEAKILVVGQPEVGKTDLTHWLIHNEPHDDPKTTEGIQIECWTPEGDDGVKINVWDFGGQEIMRATHQFFLTERSLYLLVLDSRQSEEQNKVRSWLERIANFGKDAPVLVALNKADQWEPSFNRAQLRKDYPENLGKIAFFETACQDGRRVNMGSGIDALRTHILERVRELDGVRKPMPAEFHSAKAAIQAEARAKSKLTHERFDEICIEHGIPDAGQRGLLLYFLKNLGALFHYHTHAGEGSKARTFVLDPRWLTAGVYAILTNPELGEKDGVLDQRDLPAIFGDAEMTRGRTYTAEDRDFILDMMEGEPFELCFPLPDQPGKRWLVPQLLDTDTPEHGIEREAGIALRYEYRHLPTGLVPRFIVRTHTRLGKAKPWRDGAVLTIDGSRVLVLGVPEKNYVDVVAEERTPAARRAVRFVRDQLEMIHEAMKLEGVEAWLTPPDDAAASVPLSQLYRWRDDPDMGLGYKFEPFRATHKYTVGALLDHLEQGAPSNARDPRRERERDDIAGLHDKVDRLAESIAETKPAAATPLDKENLARLDSVIGYLNKEGDLSETHLKLLQSAWSQSVQFRQAPAQRSSYRTVVAYAISRGEVSIPHPQWLRDELSDESQADETREGLKAIWGLVSGETCVYFDPPTKGGSDPSTAFTKAYGRAHKTLHGEEKARGRSRATIIDSKRDRDRPRDA